MPPSIELSPNTFARLQAHAVPLIDSIETVINRLIDAFESNDGTPVSETGNYDKIRQFNPLSPPDLTHTKVLSMEFCGRPFDRSQTNWAGLLKAAIREAKAQAKSPKELKSLVVIPFVEGKKTDEGYGFLPDLGISIQGQDSKGVWKAVCHVAQQLGRPLVVTFVWREKEGAAFPGATGRFSMAGR